MRLWVNGQPLIDNWTVHGPEADSGTITLEEGHRYEITLEYFQGGGLAWMQLLWSGPGVTQQSIPQNQLYPALVPPQLSSPAQYALLSSRDVPLNWQGFDPTQTYQLRLSQDPDPDAERWLSDAQVSGAASPFTVTVPDDGIYYWHMRTLTSLSPEEGSYWTTRLFVVDTQAPAASYISPDVPSYYSSDLISGSGQCK